jgi:hypothetical protein
MVLLAFWPCYKKIPNSYSLMSLNLCFFFKNTKALDVSPVLFYRQLSVRKGRDLSNCVSSVKSSINFFALKTSDISNFLLWVTDYPFVSVVDPCIFFSDPDPRSCSSDLSIRILIQKAS